MSDFYHSKQTRGRCVLIFNFNVRFHCIYGSLGKSHSLVNETPVLKTEQLPFICHYEGYLIFQARTRGNTRLHDNTFHMSVIL